MGGEQLASTADQVRGAQPKPVRRPSGPGRRRLSAPAPCSPDRLNFSGDTSPSPALGGSNRVRRLTMHRGCRALWRGRSCSSLRLELSVDVDLRASDLMRNWSSVLPDTEAANAAAQSTRVRRLR